MKNGLLFAPITFIMGEPHKDSERVDEGLCGMEIEILSNSSKEWVEIKTKYHYTGYVHKNDIIQDEKTLQFWHGLEKKVVISSCTDVLTEPRIQSVLKVTITRGGVIGVLSKADAEGWIKVALCDGSKGFIRASHLGEFIVSINNKNEVLLRQSIVKTAYDYLGTGYRWGGKTPMGIDCSGLCFMAYYLNGISIYRDAAIKEGFPVKEIHISQIKKADLLFFPGHVAMYIGNQRYIHSTLKKGSDGVVINSLNPNDEDYREDLAKKIKAVGSIFGG